MCKTKNFQEDRVIRLILAELRKAEQAHPTWPEDNVHAAAIVGEESGELIRAALQEEYECGSKDEMVKEAIQTGAMAVRFLLNVLFR